jgi:hypothetical protein
MVLQPAKAKASQIGERKRIATRMNWKCAIIRRRAAGASLAYNNDNLRVIRLKGNSYGKHQALAETRHRRADQQ